MLTGYSSKDVAVEALKARADDYIEKPININKTKEIIERLLDKKNGEDGKYWQYFVNGEYAKVGVSQYGLKAGDAVEWKFTDNKLKSKN